MEHPEKDGLLIWDRESTKFNFNPKECPKEIHKRDLTVETPITKKR